MAATSSTGLPIHRLDVSTYGQMVASGALDGHRVELLDGIITELSPQSPEHVLLTELLGQRLATATGRVRVQMPLEVDDFSTPEPDLAVVIGPPTAHAHPRTAVLVVEVAVSSHPVDRGVKDRLYAGADIPVYWVVDLPGRSIEVRSSPSGDGYQDVRIYGGSDVVPSPADGVGPLSVAELFDAF